MIRVSAVWLSFTFNSNGHVRTLPPFYGTLGFYNTHNELDDITTQVKHIGMDGLP